MQLIMKQLATVTSLKVVTGTLCKQLTWQMFECSCTGALWWMEREWRLRYGTRLDRNATELSPARMHVALVGFPVYVSDDFYVVFH